MTKCYNLKGMRLVLLLLTLKVYTFLGITKSPSSRPFLFVQCRKLLKSYFLAWEQDWMSQRNLHPKPEEILNHDSVAATQMRDDLADFFSGEGALDWQWEHIFGKWILSYDCFMLCHWFDYPKTKKKSNIIWNIALPFFI